MGLVALSEYSLTTPFCLRQEQLYVVNGGRRSAQSKPPAHGHLPNHVTTKAHRLLRASCCPSAERAHQLPSLLYYRWVDTLWNPMRFTATLGGASQLQHPFSPPRVPLLAYACEVSLYTLLSQRLMPLPRDCHELTCNLLIQLYYLPASSSKSVTLEVKKPVHALTSKVPACQYNQVFQTHMLLLKNLSINKQISHHIRLQFFSSLNAIETCFVGLYCNRDPSLRLSELFITKTIFMLYSTQEMYKQGILLLQLQFLSKQHTHKHTSQCCS